MADNLTPKERIDEVLIHLFELSKEEDYSDCFTTLENAIRKAKCLYKREAAATRQDEIKKVKGVKR